MNGARCDRRGALAVALVVSAGLAGSALGQTGANIRRDLRPMVSVSLSNPVPAPNNGVMMGIFDTGATGVFIPPTATTYLGLPAAYTGGVLVGPPPPRNAPPFYNYSRVTNPYTLTIGGLMGGTFGGAEVTTGGGAPQPAQIFGTAADLNRTDGLSQTAISPATNWYNGRFNNVIIGGGYFNGTATSRPLVGFVDPINAGYTPFAFGTINGNMPAGTQFPPTNFLDSTYTSVSLMRPGVDIPLPLGGSVYLPNVQVPTLNQNYNPNFLFGIGMTPVTVGGAVLPSFTRSNQAVTGATDGARPQINVTAQISTLLGRSQNPASAGAGDLAANSNAAVGTYVADTGAPTSDNAGGGTNLLGTDLFNGFGQFWDFSANPGNNNAPTMLMFGPRLQGDRDLVSTGMLMTVDRNATGLTRTGVEQFAQYGRGAIMVPAGGSNPDGSVNANGTPVAATNVAGVQAQTIFRTHMTQSNAGYISGTEAMNLIAGADQIDGLSVGADPIARRSMIFFSVDAASTGRIGGFEVLPGSGGNPGGVLPVGGQGFGGGVFGQSQLGQQAGDVFQSITAGRPLSFVIVDRLNPNGQVVQLVNAGSNELRFNQDSMGLAGNAGPLASANGWGNHDNMRDFDLQAIDGMNGAVAANVMRNIDPVIRAGGDTYNPAAGTVHSQGGRFDVLGTTFNTFITLDAASPGLGAVGASPSDILRNAPVGVGMQVFATGVQAGLQAPFANDIDAIALDRVNFPGYTGPLFQGLGMVVGAGGYVPLNVFQPYGGLLPDFAGIDRFFNMLSDVMLFSLAPGSAALNFFDPILGRQLSAADIFITDFDGTFQLYATAESMGLLSTDNIDGLDVRAIPAPGAVVLLGLGGVLASRRRRSRTV